MGRTRPTFRDELDRIEADWQPFRRSLRRRHQPAFDRLFEHARGHADAAGQQNPAEGWRGVVLAVLLAQERERAALEAELEERAEHVETLREQVETLRERIDEQRGRIEELESTADAAGSRDGSGRSDGGAAE